MRILYPRWIFSTTTLFLVSLLFTIIPDRGVCQDQSATIRFLQKASISEKMNFWAELSSQLNQQLPMQVDSETRVLNAAPLENGIRWNYEMINFMRSDHPESYWNDFLDYTKKVSATRFCTTPDSLFFRKSNATIHLYYYDKGGSFIGRVVFLAGERCAG